MFSIFFYKNVNDHTKSNLQNLDITKMNLCWSYCHTSDSGNAMLPICNNPTLVTSRVILYLSLHLSSPTPFPWPWDGPGAYSHALAFVGDLFCRSGVTLPTPGASVGDPPGGGSLPEIMSYLHHDQRDSSVQDRHIGP